MPDLNRMGLSRSGGPVGSYSPAVASTFPTTSVLDDFNRANEGPPPSASWGGVIASGQGGLKVVSNKVTWNASDDGTGYWGTQFNANQDAFVHLTDITGSSIILLYARLLSPGTASPDGYFVRYDASGSDSSIYRMDDGTGTLLVGLGANSLNSGDD